MRMVLVAPRKYVQGRGVLGELGSFVAPIGKRPLVLWDAKVRGVVGETVLESLKGASLKAVAVEFAGESTRAEAERVAALARTQKADVIVGIGGGKALDTAKAAAARAGTKTVTVPTIASNDSPTSSFTVWYDDKHNCLGFESWGVNPDLVLVDTLVIAQAPVRAFVAGMGDALATHLEAEACFKARGGNLVGGQPTMAARALARLCYETLLAHGVEAKRALEQKAVTPAVEKVVEANVLLSGLGFESGGVATAHMVANALPGLAECRGLMHGEEVAWGIMTQLCLDEDMPPDEVRRIVDFMVAVGLPVTLADVGLAGATRERLRPIGDACAVKGSLCENHPFEVTSEGLVDAMIAADALGAARKALAAAGQ